MEDAYNDSDALLDHAAIEDGRPQRDGQKSTLRSTASGSL